MKNNLVFLTYLLLLPLLSCATQAPQQQEQDTGPKMSPQVLAAIDSGNLTQFEETIASKNLSQSHQLHNYLAAQCLQKSQQVSKEMALSLIAKGVEPMEEDYLQHEESYKAPLQTSLLQGCNPLLLVYLHYMGPQSIAQASLAMRATDFVSFTEKIIDKEPLSSELKFMEQAPLSVDLAIQKNSQLCQQSNSNCLARDHLLTELASMKEAVTKFAYYKACTTQIALINTLELMREQVEFAKVTGVASPQTYDGHASHAQELRGWFKYYQQLFFKNTGEEANLEQCYL